MVRSFKSTLLIEFALLVLGYTAFLLFVDFAYANAFLGGFIIICIDLLFLARYLNNAFRNSSAAGFLMQSIFRWFFIAVCIYIALVKLDMYKWSFAVGIILPFLGVFITGIYQIFRGKEDGTSS